MKNSNDTIGNRTRDLLTCSAVPQPTAPPRSPPPFVITPSLLEQKVMFRVCTRGRFEHCTGVTSERCSDLPHSISLILIFVLEETHGAYNYFGTEKCFAHI